MELLDKSRSAVSRTHTTSSAPAPSLTPATIAQASASNNIISILHSADADPFLLQFYNALDASSLHELSYKFISSLQERISTINDLITTSQNAPVSASERTRRLWNDNKVQVEELLLVYTAAGKDDGALSEEEGKRRETYYKKTASLWKVQLRTAFEIIDNEFVGPYALGNYSFFNDHLLMANQESIFRRSSLHCGSTPRLLACAYCDPTWLHRNG